MTGQQHFKATPLHHLQMKQGYPAIFQTIQILAGHEKFVILSRHQISVKDIGVKVPSSSFTTLYNFPSKVDVGGKQKALWLRKFPSFICKWFFTCIHTPSSSLTKKKAKMRRCLVHIKMDFSLQEAWQRKKDKSKKSTMSLILPCK